VGSVDGVSEDKDFEQQKAAHFIEVGLCLGLAKLS
jgi:hypothetical protein